MADYTTAAQIIIDPNLSDDEKVQKLREFEQTGRASYNTPAPAAPEAQTLEYTPQDARAPKTLEYPAQYDPIDPYVLETDPLGIPGTGVPPRPLPAGGIQTGPTPAPPAYRDDGSLTVMGLRQARLLKAQPPGILGAATGGGAGRPRLYAQMGPVVETPLTQYADGAGGAPMDTPSTKDQLKDKSVAGGGSPSVDETILPGGEQSAQPANSDAAGDFAAQKSAQLQKNFENTIDAINELNTRWSILNEQLKSKQGTGATPEEDEQLANDRENIGAQMAAIEARRESAMAELQGYRNQASELHLDLTGYFDALDPAGATPTIPGTQPEAPKQTAKKPSGGGKLQKKEEQKPPPLFSPWDGSFQRFEPDPDLPMLQSTRARPDWPRHMEWNPDEPYIFEDNKDPNKSKKIQDLEARLADLQSRRDGGESGGSVGVDELIALDDEINIVSAELETLRSTTSSFVDTIATELGVDKKEVITKLLGPEGMTFTQTDENGNKVGVRYKLKYNPDTKEVQIMYSTPKFVTSLDKKREAIDKLVEAKKFAMPFERDERIEQQESVMARAEAISKQMEIIRQKANALSQRQVDPQRWMRNASLGNQVGAMLYMTCMGMMGGVEGIKAAATDINNLIQRDIDIQVDSISRDKDYVKFLQDDILNIEKEYTNREAQIKAKHVLALEKAIQAALRTPGADPASVDALVAELEYNKATEGVALDTLEKRDYTDLYKAPEAPKYGGGGKPKNIATEGWFVWNGRWISNDVAKAYPSLTEASTGRPSPIEKSNRADELAAVAAELETNPDKYTTAIGGNADKRNMRERAVIALKMGSDESDRTGADGRIGAWTEDNSVQGVRNIAARLRGIAAAMRQQAVREARIPEDLGIPTSAWGGPGSGTEPPSMTGFGKTGTPSETGGTK